MSDRIASIRSRVAGATPGPWAEPELMPGGHWCFLMLNPTMSVHCAHRPDADLIAHAPDDLSWLCDRLGEAERLVDDARAMLFNYETGYDPYPWGERARAFLARASGTTPRGEGT